jgi:hypothetical protein
VNYDGISSGRSNISCGMGSAAGAGARRVGAGFDLRFLVFFAARAGFRRVEDFFDAFGLALDRFGALRFRFFAMSAPSDLVGLRILSQKLDKLTPA